MEFILPVALFFVIAAFAGILLFYLSNKFPGQETDSTIEIRNVLPGLNCGVCGFAGCDDYAKSCAIDGTPPNLCIPGGKDTADAISTLTRIPYDEMKDLIAFVHCRGNYDATHDKYNYRGVLSCAASSQFYGGRSSCHDGCLGFGDCVEVCPSDAIAIVNGCAVVDRNKCTGCMLCAKICPKHIIFGESKNATVIVACRSKATGRETRLTCKNGCISCKRCEKACNFNAIKVHDNFATINQALCTSCGECVKVCPVKCIVQL